MCFVLFFVVVVHKVAVGLLLFCFHFFSSGKYLCVGMLYNRTNLFSSSLFCFVCLHNIAALFISASRAFG